VAIVVAAVSASIAVAVATSAATSERVGSRPSRGRHRYAAHLHNAPCSAANPGGGHYKDDPAGLSEPPNELWLSSTTDPKGGITANPAGVAHGAGSADCVARPEAHAIVIHAIPPGGTTAGGPKIGWADLE
jgi:hypothetical protein